MKAFKAYDVRGVYNRDFSKEDVYRIGFFLPQLLKADRVLVGRDVRASSDEIHESLCTGITDAGANVYDAGLTTTPMVYWGTAKYNFPASVQITASHNPPEYNGLKVSASGAVPVGYETGLRELEDLVIHEEVVRTKHRGMVEVFDLLPEYAEFLKGWLGHSGLSIGIDCSNGMASILARKILGDAPKYLFDTLDGTFPNHEPNPLIESNVADLQRLVRQHDLDLGMIFDGDADRVMFVDERGNFISPDLMIGVIGRYFLQKEKGVVLHDIRTSRGVSEYVTKLGGTPCMWKVGHAFAKIKMRETAAVFGGELAGHYYFRDFYNCDSGMLAALIILDVVSKLKREGTTLSDFIKEVNPYAFSGEINFRIDRKNEAMKTLRIKMSERETPTAVHDFDGYRVEFRDWWFNVRPSNTEPYLRLVVEARTEEMLSGKLDALTEIIKPFE